MDFLDFLLTLASITLVCLLIILAAIHIKKWIFKYEQRFDRLEKQAQVAMADVSVMSTNVNGVIESGTVFFDAYIFTTTLLAIYALMRNLYNRYKKKEEKKENLSEQEVLKLFDVAALAIIIPLFYTNGTNAAFAVWGTLTKMCSMIRTACSGFHLFSKIFEDTDVPFVPESQLQNVLDTVDELSARVEEHKQGKDRHATANPYASLDEDFEDCIVCEKAILTIGINGMCKACACKQAPDWKVCPRCEDINYNANVMTICHVCAVRNSSKISEKDLMNLQGAGKVDGNKSGVGNKIKIPVARPVDGGKSHKALESVEYIFCDKQDKGYLRDLEQTIKNKPWILPVVFFLLFGFLLVFARWQQPGKKKVSFEQQERKSSNKSKGRKPWIDYDPVSDDDDYQSLMEDEQGNLVRSDNKKLGRRARRTAKNNAAYGGDKDVHGNYAYDVAFGVKESLSQNKINGCMHFEGCPLMPKHMSCFLSTNDCNLNCGGDNCEHWDSCVPSKVEEKEMVVKSSTSFLPPCKTVGCDQSCGNYHKKKSAEKAVATKAKSIKKKAKVAKPEVKKEALVNGPRFNTSDVCKSVGYAVAGDSMMNCTFLWQGIMLCAHLFKATQDTVTITLGSVSGTFNKADFKKVGNDLLFLPATFATKIFPLAKSLRASLPKVNDKVRLIAFDSDEDQKIGKFKDDDGRVKSIIETVGAEKAYYSVSSVDGCCGAPVVNVDGKVVGFHNFTTSTDTGFIPITKHISQQSNGSF